MREPSRVIYIDIDDTLVGGFDGSRKPVEDMVALVKRLCEHGATLYCWSSGGAAYARHTAEDLGIDDFFTEFLPKPHMIIDDTALREWNIVELQPGECRSMSAFELLARIGRLSGGDQ